MRWLLPAIAGLALAGPGSIRAEESRPARLLLPPVVSVYEAGLAGSIRHGQWSQLATGNVESAWTAALADRAVPASDLTSEQSAAAYEFQRLAVDVARNAKQRGGGSQGLAGFDARLGPALSFFATERGATTVIGLVAVQREQSTSSAATQTAAVASMFFQPYLIFVPSFTGVELLAFEADARTGQVLWYEFDRAVEVVGVNTGDLRDAASTQRLLVTLAARLPASTPPAPAAANVASGTSGASHREMALHGYFQFQAPLGWTTRPAARSVTATRDGPLLNAMDVRLVPRGDAFEATRPPWSGDSTPGQFAQWFTAELQASEIMDLQVLEAAAVGQLAGQPAFRVRYLHRGWVDGPLQETVIVGTALTRGLLLASLTAPHLAYFEHALPDFEAMLPTVERAPIRN